ncbi:MAG: hypothetical protein QOF89_5893 [Acidobacteriota bacterium]|jgi:hypothetical protein|nr:hypothetical protein [Acidobacteriota bacterium]
MKPWLLSILCAAGLLAACSASSVKTEIPETSRYAPVDDKVDGEVSYLNAGAKSVRNARREDAYKKMYEHCGGPYKIVREEDQQGGWVPGGIQRRIWFKCVEKDAEPTEKGSGSGAGGC